MKHSYLTFTDLYGTEQMRAVWGETNMVQKWLDVEAAIARAQADLALLPQDTAEAIVRNCSVERLDVQSIYEKKQEVRHLMVSVLQAFAEKCGVHGEQIHLGATTQDILDTGLTLQIREALEIILEELLSLELRLLALAQEHKTTAMMGRTHAQHAAPLTFGFKVAIWASEIFDHIQRLKDCSARLHLLSLSGAVGTNASFVYLFGKEKTDAFRSRVAQYLDLSKPAIDLHQRTDRFVELANVLALIGTTLGRIGFAIRDLQATEVAEVSEPWVAGKNMSSSTMPHKRNPDRSEWLNGLAKLLRANAASLASVEMQHERDATWMAVAYATLPECFLNCAAGTRLARTVLDGLEVSRAHMQRNLNLTQGLAMSEAVMLGLYEKTGRKLWAHRICYDCALSAQETGRPLKDELLANAEIRNVLSEAEIDALLDPENYLGDCAEQVDAIVARIRAELFPGPKTRKEQSVIGRSAPTR
ncbi:MAG: adenylosuccinate lyase [Alphaproteobacteria bacterium]|nr:adenylosuccinate lyase [Alphaproteobacteria bacterium]